MAGRRIFIGDVQGCATELAELLDRVALVPGQDRVFFVGDLICRGPRSLDALRLAAEVRAEGVLGNHEARVLRKRFFARKPQKAAKAFPELGELAAAEDREDFEHHIRDLPFLRLVDDDITLVHAGIPPRLWEGGAPEELAAFATRRWSAEPDEEEAFCLHVRHCDASGARPDKDHPPPGEPYEPWDRFYEGERLVVFGHWARRGLVETASVRGLDTGCVYGGKLSAWIAEEDRIVQVSARRAYWPRGNR